MKHNSTNNKQESKKKLNQTKQTVKGINILFWNINGLSNLFKLDSQQEDNLKEAEIICLVETWSLETVVTKPQLLQDYDTIVSPAKKEKALDDLVPD